MVSKFSSPSSMYCMKFDRNRVMHDQCRKFGSRIKVAQIASKFHRDILVVIVEFYTKFQLNRMFSLCAMKF